jgi:protein-S-isoprenylcysteine O-methyltransferase Ste14
MAEHTGWARVARRIRVPLGFAFAGLYLWLAQPVWYCLLAGGAVAVGGLVLRAAASGHVQKNSKLTTTGPYAYTRNPLYLGSAIIAAGFAVAGRNLWILVLLAGIFLLVYLPVVRAEERFLNAEFSEYAAYASRVPRFGIRLRNPESAGDTRFSVRLYLKHREYNAIIGAAGMMLALVVKMLWP